MTSHHIVGTDNGSSGPRGTAWSDASVDDDPPDAPVWVLQAWTRRWGRLHPDHISRFLRRQEARELGSYPRALVIPLLCRHRKLADALTLLTAAIKGTELGSVLRTLEVWTRHYGPLEPSAEAAFLERPEAALLSRYPERFIVIGLVEYADVGAALGEVRRLIAMNGWEVPHASAPQGAHDSDEEDFSFVDEDSDEDGLPLIDDDVPAWGLPAWVAPSPTSTLDLLIWDRPTSLQPETLARLRVKNAGILARHPRAWSRWVEDEDLYLTTLFHCGYSASTLEYLHQRQPSAVISRLMKLGVITGPDELVSEPASAVGDATMPALRGQARALGADGV